MTGEELIDAIYAEAVERAAASGIGPLPAIDDLPPLVVALLMDSADAVLDRFRRTYSGGASSHSGWQGADARQNQAAALGFLD